MARGGGKGSNGEVASISSGKVTVPKRCWKVILIMPEGINDVIRLNSGVKSEIIAIDVPNSQDVSGTRWRNYELKVRELEGRTGLNFFTELDQNIQDKIEN
ncbi:DNA/RNA non-specific endonuclease [Siphonobacter sp. SORGH_AS_0500]|uniref:DNA/RNA non-specific endonuclease n=1 Tax=Siphonobacter sp. SORGH_AS_0500 TaxID=1864824 RepID=UPI0012FED14B|nr:DNA/RNA non-specific endonuclease [Siphonobacter sp. SORGH_AS_0500]